jgi:hypothetical protein
MNFFIFNPPYIEFPKIGIRENGEFYIDEPSEYEQSDIYIQTPKLKLRREIGKTADFILDHLTLNFLNEFFDELIKLFNKQHSEYTLRLLKTHTRRPILEIDDIHFIQCKVKDVFICDEKTGLPVKKTDVKDQYLRPILAINSFKQNGDIFHFDVEVKQIYVLGNS